MSRSHSCWANRTAITIGTSARAWLCKMCWHSWLQGEPAQPENVGLDTRHVAPGTKCRASFYAGVGTYAWFGSPRCNRPLPCPDHSTLQAVT